MTQTKTLTLTLIAATAAALTACSSGGGGGDITTSGFPACPQVGEILKLDPNYTSKDGFSCYDQAANKIWIGGYDDATKTYSWGDLSAVEGGVVVRQD